MDQENSEYAKMRQNKEEMEGEDAKEEKKEKSVTVESKVTVFSSFQCASEGSRWERIHPAGHAGSVDDC